MKSLCGFVLLLALILPGCASSRPVDVVNRDGQRWVTVPKAGISFPLLGVFEGAKGSKFDAKTVAFDVSSSVGSDCVMIAFILDATDFEGRRSFREEDIPVMLERIGRSGNITNATAQITPDRKCMSFLGAHNNKTGDDYSLFSCLGSNDKVAGIGVGGTASCVGEQTPTLVKMMEHRR